MSENPFADALADIQSPATAPPAAETPPPSDNPFAAALAAQKAAPEASQEQDKGPAPEWSEISGQAKSNFGKSAVNFGSNIAYAVMHPIETGENIGSVGLGYMEKAGKAVGLPSGQGYEQYADAVNKMVMDRYGSMDNFKKTLATDPVGAAADLSTVLTGGGGLLAKAPSIAGKIGDAVSLAGKIADPLTIPVAAASGVAKGVGAIGKEVLGHQTGLGPEAISEMAKSGVEGGAAGQTFRDNMRGNVPIEAPVEQARTALENLRKERGDEYRAGMAGVAANTTVPQGAWNQIGRAIRDANDIKTFKGQDLSPKTAAVRSELNDMVLDWMALPAHEYHTAEGLDALKQKIGDVRDALSYGTPEKLVANKYYGAVRQSIIDHVPEYAKVMKGYEEASDQLRQIEKTLSLPQNERKASIDTSLRKLQSILRNNVSTNYGYRQKLVEYLENAGAPNLKAALAGQSANSFTPRGLSKVSALLGAEGVAALAGAWFSAPIAVPAAGLALAASSPRIVGETVHGISRAVGAAKKYGVGAQPSLRAAQQAGRIDVYRGQHPEMQSRGGAVDRALRASKRGRNG